VSSSDDWRAAYLSLSCHPRAPRPTAIWIPRALIGLDTESAQRRNKWREGLVDVVALDYIFRSKGTVGV